jgi:hypothetical protein
MMKNAETTHRGRMIGPAMAKAIACLAIILTLGGIATPSFAGPLRAGAGKMSITPAKDEFPYTAPGERPYVGVHDPVYARALALDDGSHRIVILSIEVTAVPDPSRLIQSVAQATGVPQAGLFVVATHTHNVPLASNHGMQQDAVMSRETERVRQGAIEAARMAVSHLEPASLSFQRGEAWVNINNGEEAGLKSWNDPRGSSDKTLDVLKIDNQKGKALALLVNYASHAEVMFRSASRNNGYEVSGDLPGAASRLLEQSPSGAPVVLFTPSAEADQLPLFKSLQPAGNLPATDEGPAGWGLLDLLARRLAGATLDTVAATRPGTAEAHIESASGTVTCPGQQLQIDKAGKLESQERPPVVIPLSMIRINDIALVGIGGDLSSAIGRSIKNNSPVKNTIVNTMLAGSVGYVFSDASYKHPGHGLLLSPLKSGCAEKAITKGLVALLNKRQ